jgi:hypothetical protein
MYTLCVCMYVCVFTNIKGRRSTTKSAAATLRANEHSCRLAAVIAVPVRAQFVTGYPPNGGGGVMQNDVFDSI